MIPDGGGGVVTRRVAQVRTVPDPYQQPRPKAVVLGHLIDPGDGSKPFGTTDAADSMLQGSRPFDYYYGGWSNGYYETQPVTGAQATKVADRE